MSDRVLQVERQHVAVSPVVVVQVAAHSEQEALRAFRVEPRALGQGLAAGRYAARFDVLQLRYPAGEMVVPQASRTLLDVGFQMVQSVLEGLVALAGLLDQGAQQGALLPQVELRQQAILQRRDESFVTGDEARVEHADVQVRVVARQAGAILGGPHRVGNL